MWKHGLLFVRVMYVCVCVYVARGECKYDGARVSRSPVPSGRCYRPHYEDA